LLASGPGQGTHGWVTKAEEIDSALAPPKIRHPSFELDHVSTWPTTRSAAWRLSTIWRLVETTGYPWTASGTEPAGPGTRRRLLSALSNHSAGHRGTYGPGSPVDVIAFVADTAVQPVAVQVSWLYAIRRGERPLIRAVGRVSH